MKVLVITNLFPNSKQPGRGVFNKQQLVELANLCDLRVVAPLPWVPKVGFKGAKTVIAEAADEESIEGISVYHPRYFVTPKIGRSFYGRFYYWGIRKLVYKIYEEFKFDKIFATWAYPDAYAAALLAGELKVPLIIKVHGTDVNIAGRSGIRRKKMTYAFAKAQAVIAVSRSLKDKIAAMGIPEDKIELIGNGVDTRLFKSMDKLECKARFNIDKAKKLVVYIGNLVSVKGIDHLVEAFRSLPEDYWLQIIGDGDMRKSLEERIEKINLKNRVGFQGRISHKEIPYWLNAADVFCLPSMNEGCPNVILEALACGTPVVASKVGGVPDLIVEDENGKLVEPGKPEELSKAICYVMERQQNGSRFHPKRNMMSWQENASKVAEILYREG